MSNYNKLLFSISFSSNLSLSEINIDLCITDMKGDISSAIY